MIFKYEFSRFEGFAFLESYRESRLDFIEKIKSKVKNIKDLSSHVSGFKKSGKMDLKNLDKSQFISTKEILEHLLVSASSNKNNDSVYHWLSRLLKKFEAGRKLYSKYDSKMKKVDNEFQNPRLYILLCLCCLLFYKKSKNLKFINTALKLNDSISTIFQDLTKDEMSLWLACLENELGEVIELAREKGIRL